MRQLLILGFYCEVYRREPLCRVYVNDVLLDEFNIPHTIEKEINSPLADPLNPLDAKIFQNFLLNRLKTNPPFLKYIEFDDGDTDILNITLKIQNDDNNYNNTFMTKYTYIMLPWIYLLSKKSLENIKSIEQNYKYSRKNWEKYNDIVNYYPDRLYIFIHNLLNCAKLNFPGIKVENLNKSRYKIGSTGDFHLTLQKKLGFWKPNTDSYKGYWLFGFTKFIEYFYNKYKQYENQRSSNT